MRIPPQPPVAPIPVPAPSGDPGAAGDAAAAGDAGRVTPKIRNQDWEQISDLYAGLPYTAIGAIRMTFAFGSGGCSGSLIGNHTVITAGVSAGCFVVLRWFPTARRWALAAAAARGRSLGTTPSSLRG